MDINKIITDKNSLRQTEVRENIYKSFTGVYDLDLEKASKHGDPSNGGKLKPVIITDKNGHHRTVWKSPEEIQEEKQKDHKHVIPIERGHQVMVDGKQYTFHRVTPDGYADLIDPLTNKKLPKVLTKIQAIHPEENVSLTMQETSASTKSRPTPVGIENGNGNIVTNDKGQTLYDGVVEDDKPVDYELYGTPTERMYDWERLINNFAKGNSRNVTISYGTGGVGKTYSVLNNALIKQGIEEGTFVKYTGGTTPAGFFEMLYKNRDKNIMLDDFDMVFKDPSMLSLLVNMSRNTGEIVLTNPSSGNLHESDSEDSIPNQFEFTGKLMVISNINLEEEAEKARSGDKFERLLTNADKVNLKLTRQETWDLMNEKILHDSRPMINGKPNPNLGGLNPNLKFQNALGEKITITDKAKQELADYFSENWQDMIELSGRTLTKANAIRSFYLDKGEDWKFYANAMLLKNGPQLDINKRFDVFNDSLEMLHKGNLKSAVISDKDSETIQETLKDFGMKKTPIGGGFEMVDQLSPDFVPNETDVPITDQFVVISGSDLTEKALYETLWKHNGKVIVFDKSAKKFLKSDLGQGLLKGALDTSGDGELAWLTSVNTGKKKPNYKPSDFEEGGFAEQLKLDGYNFEMDDAGRPDMKTLSHPHDLPDKFAFKGRCIFLVDDPADAPQPIQSRSMIADVKTSPEEFLQRAEWVANHRERKNKAFSKVFKNVSPAEYREALRTMNAMKDQIHSRYFNEEGLQKIIRINRDLQDSDKDTKQRILKRELVKGISNEDIEESFRKIFE